MLDSGTGCQKVETRKQQAGTRNRDEARVQETGPGEQEPRNKESEAQG